MSKCYASYDEYGFRYLPGHLIRSGRGEKLREMLIEYDWLRAKLDATDVNAIIGDYDHLPEDEEVHLVQSAIRLSSEGLSYDSSILSNQLYGRLMSLDFPSIKKLVEDIRGRTSVTWLRSLVAALMPPGLPLIRTLHASNEGVYFLEVTKDGSRAIAALDNLHTVIKVWNIESGEELQSIKGHGPKLALAPDEKHIAVYGEGRIKILDLESGMELCSLSESRSGWGFFSISPNSKWILSSSDGALGELAIWDINSGAMLQRLKGHTLAVYTAEFSSDNKIVVSGGCDNILIVWDPQTGRRIRKLGEHHDIVQKVIISPDMRRVISVSADKTLKVWSLERGKVWNLARGAELYSFTGERPIQLSPDGRYLIAVSDKHKYTLGVWDLECGKRIHTLSGHTDFIDTIEVAPDGRRVISGSMDNTLKVWDIQTGVDLRTLRGHSSHVNHIRITSDGRKVVSGSLDGSLKVWDLNNETDIPVWKGHTQNILAVSVSEDGKTATSVSEDQSVKKWNIDFGTEIRTIDKGLFPYTWRAAITPDGSRIFANSGEEGELILYHVTSSGVDRHNGRIGHHEAIWKLALTPDGSLGVSVCAAQELKVWDLDHGFKGLRSINGVSPFVALGQSYCLFAPKEGLPRLLDLVTNSELEVFKEYHSPISAVGISRDENLALAGYRDGVLKVWDIKSKAEVKTLYGHKSPIREVLFTNDIQNAISIYNDGLLVYWDLRTAEKVASFAGDSPLVCCATVSDGRTILAGESSGRLHFLRLERYR